MSNRIISLFLLFVLVSSIGYAQKIIQKTPAKQRIQWYEEYVDLKNIQSAVLVTGKAGIVH